MADKAISELVPASLVTADSLFVLQQDNTAKKLSAQVLENWLLDLADGHGGIKSIVKQSTSGLKDTYRITMADSSIFDFQVTNGKGISKIEKTKTSGLVDTYTITFNDNTTTTFTVTNGAKGDKGDNSYVWIKYASQKPTASSHSIGDLPDAWIGIYSGNLSSAPTDWQAYSWYPWKGEVGDTGEPATLLNSVVDYQIGDSGTVSPSGSWSTSIPVVPQGKYLWTRVTNNFNSGNPVVSYSVTRMGLDGSGSVASVANVSPDDNGNVPLTAEHLNALSTTGGDMTGQINMNGQSISGLGAPAADDQAANLGYVKKASPCNILDNSNFANPVNQRGKTSYMGSGYGIDRWYCTSAHWMVTMEDGYLKVSDNPDSTGISTTMLRQTITVPSNLRGKTVTLAAKLKGDGMVRLNINNTAIGAYGGSDDWHIKTITGVVPADADTFYVALQSRNMETYYCEWVALYEGEFTAETLPAYRPKGYAAELLECQRYYVSFGNMTFRSTISEDPIHNITITFPVPMRIIPTISATAVEGEVPETVSVTEHGIAYSVYGAKYTLRYVSASADL